MTEDTKEEALHAADYTGAPNGRQGRGFKPWNRRGYVCIPVLEILKGYPWDDVALAYVHGINPTHIRVVKAGEGVQMDAQTGRVTVYTGEEGEIRRIEQEIRVGLPEGVENGQALQHALAYGLDSEQVRWHQGVVGYTSGFGRSYATKSDGTTVEFPKGEPRKKVLRR